MRVFRIVVAVLSPFFLAAATSHVMQTAAEAERSADVDRAEAGSGFVRLRVSGLRVASAAELPAVPGGGVAPVERDPATPAAPAPDIGAEGGFAVEARCFGASLSARAGDRAMLSVVVTAPCAAGAAAIVAQPGFAAPIELDDKGRWSGLVPAMGDRPRLSLALASAPQSPLAETALSAAGADQINRIVLTFPTAEGVSLEALEYGAVPGGAGHVGPGAPRAADTPLGGWLARYDGGGQTALVYSAPADLTDTSVFVEFPVTTSTCGRDARAQVLRLIRGEVEPAAQVAVAMPDCSDVGVGGSVAAPLPPFQPERRIESALAARVSGAPVTDNLPNAN